MINKLHSGVLERLWNKEGPQCDSDTRIVLRRENRRDFLGSMGSGRNGNMWDWFGRELEEENNEKDVLMGWHFRVG